MTGVDGEKTKRHLAFTLALDGLGNAGEATDLDFPFVKSVIGGVPFRGEAFGVNFGEPEKFIEALYQGSRALKIFFNDGADLISRDADNRFIQLHHWQSLLRHQIDHFRADVIHSMTGRDHVVQHLQNPGKEFFGRRNQTDRRFIINRHFIASIGTTNIATNITDNMVAGCTRRGTDLVNQLKAEKLLREWAEQISTPTDAGRAVSFRPLRRRLSSHGSKTAGGGGGCG
mmetsp:Transcript_6612/g.12900  ORF Transcript_6612/g.12900 Transcript_6612/m.12900 type:complete len:229 (+) Transcript_6612:1894-2580(+)